MVKFGKDVDKSMEIADKAIAGFARARKGVVVGVFVAGNAIM